MKKYLKKQSFLNICIFLMVALNIILIIFLRGYNFIIHGFTMWNLRYACICLLFVLIGLVRIKKVLRTDSKAKYVKSILNVLGVLLCMWLLSTGHSVLYHNIQYTEYAIDENRVLVMRECEYILDVLGVIYQKDGYWLKELKKVMQNGETSRADYPAQKGFYPAKEGYFWVESVEGNLVKISYRHNREKEELYSITVEIQ